jgi:L-ascorbate metabolism protein UlaG (beta-lactamase superfamily)
MKIQWIGHACFLITSDKGLRIVTDPYKTGFDKSFQYGEVNLPADIVTVSHSHGDHNNVASVIGNPVVVRETGKKTVQSIEFNGILAFHDRNGGAERGPVTIFTFVVDGIRVTHLGDLGHLLASGQLNELADTDILLIPTGGPPTIELKEALELVISINPKIAIPMHFKSAKCPFPRNSIDDLVKLRPDAVKIGASELIISEEKLPSPIAFYILDSLR